MSRSRTDQKGGVVKHRHLRAWFGVVVIGTAAIVGCGGDGPTASTGTTGETTSSVTGTGGAGGGGTGGDGGAGGTSTSTGTGGTGGAGGAPPTGKGMSGGSLVSAGHVISSPKYRMVFTVGQSSPVQTNVSSPSYKLRGGLIGATGNGK
jgi:hypothetical protein